MSELRRLWIPGPAGRLAAALRVACPARAAAVIAHPHPLHGGTLDNPVVFHTDRELHRAGFTTLRFNFRGVQGSEGTHDEGKGETEDVAAATSWLRGVSRGTPLFGIGYSFGSVCTIRHATNNPNIKAVIALGLPAGLYPLEELPHLRRPLAVIQAQNDEFGPPEQITPLLDSLQPPGTLYVVRDTTHLFPDNAQQAASQVLQAAETILPQLGKA